MPYRHSSCRFHSVVNVKENSTSTDYMLERITGLAGLGGEGGGKWERVGDCFPSRGSCFQHSGGSKDTAVPPALSPRDWTCRRQLSQSKESPGPAGRQIFGKKRPLCSPGLAPGFLLCCCLPRSAFPVLSKEQPWPHGTSQGLSG